MEVKLYVGNLPYSTKDTDLQELFSQAGNVRSAQVIRDRQSGRSKGFAFVELSSEEEARSAINMFHGRDLEGRPLTVNLARPREERPSGYRGSGSRSGGRASPPRLQRQRQSTSGGKSAPAAHDLPGEGTTEPPDPE